MKIESYLFKTPCTDMIGYVTYNLLSTYVLHTYVILHIILETKIEHCKSSEQTAILWTRYWWFLSKLAESYESNLSLFIRFGCGH